MSGDDSAGVVPDDLPRAVPRNSKWQLGLCKYFVNTGHCPKGPECKYKHPAAHDIKAARTEWIQARKQRRQLVSWVHGNPHAYAAEKKSRRAVVLADWLVEMYGKEFLNSGSGGKGEISFELLHRHGVHSTLLEPRLWQPCKLSKRQKSLLRSARIPVSEFRIPQVQGTLESDADCHHQVLNECSVLVGMHPDQATDPILQAANRLKKPFCIVPCCVFAAENTHRRYTTADGIEAPVQTYTELVLYLVEQGSASIAKLPFDGRNTAVFRML